VEEEWKTLVKAFFAARNRAWISGDLEEIDSFSLDEPIRQKIAREIHLLGCVGEERGYRYRKSKTRLEVLRVDRSGPSCTVELREHKQWFYQQSGEIERTARVQNVRMHLKKEKETIWRIHDVWIETENRERKEPRDLPDDWAPVHERDLLRGEYDRLRAYKYAELWWNGFNPAYRKFHVDCTSYVSQVMAAGGFPMEFHPRREQGWWYRHRGGGRDTWSYSWAVANALSLYLEHSRRVRVVEHPSQLKIGDVICYDWDGDGYWQHNTVVVDFDPQGMPLVNAHTVASHRRYWDYRDSYAYTANTKYRFFHILDKF
jgi:hypothetical protein